MSDVITMERVYEELKALRGAVEAMKEEIEDRFLTPEEELLVEKAIKEHREGKTITLEELKKELGH
jgi:hypothetical protein